MTDERGCQLFEELELLLLERGLVRSELVVLFELEEGGSWWCACCCCCCCCSCLVEVEVEGDESWPGADGVDLKRSHIVAIGNEGSPSLARESS